MTITDLHPVEPPSDTEPKMDQFNFTYPFCIKQIQVAEIDGRCTVYHLTPHSTGILIELAEAGGKKWVEPDGAFRAEIDLWLWIHHQDDIKQFAPPTLADRPPREPWA